jgi:single-strand DNA-binding protein
MNTLNIICRLTREPEITFTTSGKAVTNFGIAWDVGYGDNKRACFIDCKLWGERGENFARFVKKGHQVGLTCQLDMESWEDKATSKKRTKHTLDVRDFTLLPNKRDGEAPAPARQPRPPAKPQEQDDFSGPITNDDQDDSIPY